MTTTPPIRVLLVEDNPGDARLFAESLRHGQADFALRTVGSIAEIAPALAAAPADVLLLDLGLPDSEGLDTFRAVRAIAPAIPIIVLSGLADEDTAVRAVREGAQDYLVKGRLRDDPLPRIVRFSVERRRADEALRRSEARFRAAIEASPDAFAVLDAVRDASGRIVTFTLADMNTRAEKLLGGPLSRFAGRPLADWCPFGPEHESVAAFSRVVETRESIEQELESQSTAGTTWTLRRVYPLGDSVACFVRDITARKSIEDHLRQSQKMEAIGQLAAGVAHDFRNLVSAIQGHIANARHTLTPSHPALESLDQIRSAAAQAGGIAGSLLRYSVKSATEMKPVRLASILEQSVGLLRASLPAGIRIQTRFDDPDLHVSADATQLQQVIMNLAINARDAMPNGGVLSLATSTAPADPAVAPGPRGTARITVRDTGSGMSAETRARIFEPYFTTKPRGEGTGLGLAIVHGIIAEHGGAISVESTPGAGSTFTILLPAVERPAAPSTPAAPRRFALLADPNPFVREVVASMLASMNFDVLQAASIAEARRLAATQAPDLLISASILPDGDGSACITSVRDAAPRAHAIVIAPGHNGTLPPRTAALIQPFRRADLAREIELLRAASA